MKETSQTVTPFRALAFFVQVFKYRPECRINLLVGKRIKITVLEDQKGTVGMWLEQS